ncbi:YdcF family protein [Phytohabitans sp. LJ34]|uniref:YdcF family protein n=1 Tax=Phytohabitans sp. LJ34 TaxID=3452217 RepID=UPI003F8AF765
MIREDLRVDVETLWDYHDMHHELRPCDVGIGLGSHDLGVAVVAVDLFHQAMFPRIVFTGANAPTTIDRFPRGEAVHYREYAIENGVPPESVLIETRATNTAENIRFAREVLAEHKIKTRSVIIMSRPYQQRRAFATCKKLWPELDVLCASRPLSLDDYVVSIGDVNRVINMLVGDTQRIEVYAERGFAIAQHMPDEVRAAYRRLVNAGFTSRLV